MKPNLIENIRELLSETDGKLTPEYIDSLVAMADVIYLNPTPNTRICIITLASGHEVVGVAQVLDSKNDVPEIGNQIAYKNAVDQLWPAIGSIAKAIMK